MFTSGVRAILQRALSDDNFRSSLVDDPRGALQTARDNGLSLTDEEIEGLISLFAPVDDLNADSDREERENPGFTTVGG